MTQPVQKPPFVPIANFLIRRTLVLALVCMLGVFSIQSVLMVQQNRAQFANVVDEIASISVPLLSVSLWDIELKTVQQQVDLIAQRPHVGYVRLSASIGRQFEAGDSSLRDDAGRLKFTIPAPKPGSAVGELTLVANQKYLINELIRSAWFTLAGYGIFTALVCALIATMLRRNLQIPLQHMAQFATDLTPQTLTQPMLLARPPRQSVDEIDLVADGFSTLQNGLREHIAHLDDKVQERTQQLKTLAEANHLLSITDTLTGCLNRRSLEARLLEELERGKRYQRQVSVICLDLDHFKRVNDSFGHAGGDQVLRVVADQLKHSTRLNVDWIVRLGGEEFLVVLPETTLVTAVIHAERLRELICAKPVDFEGQPIRVTASFGVAQWHFPEDAQTLLGRADSLLYQAKADGRNRVYPSQHSGTDPHAHRSPHVDAVTTVGAA